MRRPPFTPRKIPGTHFCYGLSRPQGHRVDGRIRSIEKLSDLIGNRTRDLPACGASTNYATAGPHYNNREKGELFMNKIRSTVQALAKRLYTDRLYTKNHFSITYTFCIKPFNTYHNSTHLKRLSEVCVLNADLLWLEKEDLLHSPTLHVS
jgi:hypothetical protein